MDTSRRMSTGQENVTTSTSGSTGGNTSPGGDSSCSKNSESLKSWFGSYPSSNGNTSQWSTGRCNSNMENETHEIRPRAGSLVRFTASAVALFKLDHHEEHTFGVNKIEVLTIQGEDKAGNLPSKDSMSWFGWKSRPRANSEGGSGNICQRKEEITNWLNSQEGGSSWLARGRVRRSSSTKDIEEAMTGGLTKADLYMPPL